MKLIVALLVFGIIVIFHEFGHFIVAKKNGIVVEEFAVGMGPKLFGVRRGETEYTLRLLPLGGACMMLGEDTAEEVIPGSFNDFFITIPPTGFCVEVRFYLSKI